MQAEMTRSTKIAIGEKYVEFLKEQKPNTPFYKTEASKAGLGNPKSAEEWLDLVILFQNAPKIRKIELGNNTLYEVVEE